MKASENYAPASAPTYVSTPQLIDLLSGCACAVTFLLFVLFDAREAIRRRAFWFPGRVLILSALTIQLINFFDYSNVTEYPGNDVSATHADAADLLKFQHVIDSGRVVVCVFIAYLLPGLVSSRFRDVCTDFGALALSVLTHVLYEFYFVSSLKNYLSYEIGTKSKCSDWFKLFKRFDSILFDSLILLVLLSICAVFAGKSIRYIMDQKVPLVVSCCDPNSPRKCETTREHVLKCWIVVRSCQPDYIMARSVFSSLAGLVVTVCVVSMIVKWVCLSDRHCNPLNKLKRATFIFQFVFVLLGWIVVSLRWLTAVIFFPKDGGCSIFQIDDFWTRSMIELKECLDGHSIGRMLRKNSIRTQPDIVDFIRALRLHHLLMAIGVCLQRFMVLLSKASWFFSRGVFWPLVKSSGKIKLLSDSPESNFRKYKEVLGIIGMQGEMAYSLWIANQLAFEKTENHMKQGNKEAEYRCKELRKCIERGRMGYSAADEAPETSQPEEEKYYKYAAKWSWKMRAVSLIHFMLCLYDTNNSKIVDDAIEACSQAWDLMDFVDNSDPEAHLVGRAADKKFYTLHNIWKQHLQPAEPEVVQRFRNELIKDKDSGLSDKESHITVDRMHDSMDWTTAAVNISLYTTSETIGLSNTVDNIGCLLENVIVNCLTKELQKALVKECSKWAENGMEQEIYHAAFISGKAATILLDQMGEVAEDEDSNAGEGKKVAVAEGVDSKVGEGNNVAVPKGNNVALPEVKAELLETIIEVEDQNASEGNIAAVPES